MKKLYQYTVVFHEHDSGNMYIDSYIILEPKYVLVSNDWTNQWKSICSLK
jgi:hypothetical protein